MSSACLVCCSAADPLFAHARRLLSALINPEEPNHSRGHHIFFFIVDTVQPPPKCQTLATKEQNLRKKVMFFDANIHHKKRMRLRTKVTTTN